MAQVLGNISLRFGSFTTWRRYLKPLQQIRAFSPITLVLPVGFHAVDQCSQELSGIVCRKPLEDLAPGLLYPLHLLLVCLGVEERQADGGLKLIDTPQQSQYRTCTLFSGGGGLVSTATDYFRFTSMLPGRGSARRSRSLAPESVRVPRFATLTA